MEICCHDRAWMWSYICRVWSGDVEYMAVRYFSFSLVFLVCFNPFSLKPTPPILLHVNVNMF